MNVVIVSDQESAGGAAQATCRITESIAYKNGNGWFFHPTERIVLLADGGFASLGRPVHSLWQDESEIARQLYRLPRKLLPSMFPHPQTAEFAAARLRKKLAALQPGIINIHNLHAAAPWGWGPQLVEVCLEFAPVVWALHDMWSFTGRCAYSYDCEKFITGCDASCPTPHEDPKLAPEKIRAAWEERRTIYARHRDDLVIVTPSRWLSAQARRGLFAGHRIDVIPYGIYDPLNPFLRLPREDARQQLGINPSGPVLLLAAFDLTERRKGADILPKLWQHIEQRPLTILTMGRGDIKIDDSLIEVHPLGYIDDNAKKSLAYSAADVLVHPAPVDNFPNTILEALACGTPTVAMPVGGVPEIVRPGVSGWLADAATPEALGRAVDRALHDLSLGKDLRESCRTLAEKEYSLELQGRRYFELFKDLQKRR